MGGNGQGYQVDLCFPCDSLVTYTRSPKVLPGAVSTRSDTGNSVYGS